MKTSEKLFYLADWLDDNIKPNQFDFGGWGNRCFTSIRPDEDVSTCNTVCCAGGWAERAFPELQGKLWRNTYARVDFYPDVLSKWLGMDQNLKRRRGETFGQYDFNRLFLDDDHKLRLQYRTEYRKDVPMAAVLERMKACALYYAKKGR